MALENPFAAFAVENRRRTTRKSYRNFLAVGQCERSLTALVAVEDHKSAARLNSIARLAIKMHTALSEYLTHKIGARALERRKEHISATGAGDLAAFRISPAESKDNTVLYIIPFEKTTVK